MQRRGARGGANTAPGRPPTASYSQYAPQRTQMQAAQPQVSNQQQQPHQPHAPVSSSATSTAQTSQPIGAFYTTPSFAQQSQRHGQDAYAPSVTQNGHATHPPTAPITSSSLHDHTQQNGTSFYENSFYATPKPETFDTQRPDLSPTNPSHPFPQSTQSVTQSPQFVSSPQFSSSPNVAPVPHIQVTQQHQTYPTMSAGIDTGKSMESTQANAHNFVPLSSSQQSHMSQPHPQQPYPQSNPNTYSMHHTQTHIQQQQQPPPHSSVHTTQSIPPPTMPFSLAGMAQQLVTNAGAPGGAGVAAAAAFAPQIMQNIGQSMGVDASAWTSTPGQSTDAANSFLRVPKRYFNVTNAYVRRKLLILLLPCVNRTWARRRAVEQPHGHFDRNVSEDASAYLPPRDDVNAPDLYIPAMSFVTYVLLVGFVFGIQNAFSAEILARYCSKGLAVLSLEVVLLKLGLYLINARPTPWLDVIAYRGYKFVGVISAIVAECLYPPAYYPSLAFTAMSMVLFLLRSHKRIILPPGSEHQNPADLAQRNLFLLLICFLQFPIYWVLILDIRSIKSAPS